MLKKLITICFIYLFTPYSLAYSQEINIEVNGLVCEFCAATMEKNFNKKLEVLNTKIDLETKKIFINFKPNSNLSDEEITQIIEDNGYNVVKINRK